MWKNDADLSLLDLLLGNCDVWMLIADAKSYRIEMFGDRAAVVESSDF